MVLINRFAYYVFTVVFFSFLACQTYAYTYSMSIHHDGGDTTLYYAYSTREPDGQVVLHCGLKFELQPGWHIYWKTAGSYGKSTNIDYEKTSNEIKVQTEWPLPQRIVDDGNQSFIYKDTVIIPVDVYIKDITQDTQVLLSAHYSMCATDTCVPIVDKFNLTIPEYAFDSDANQELHKYENLIAKNEGSNTIVSASKLYIYPKKPVTLELKLRSPTELKDADIFIENIDGIYTSPPKITTSETGDTAIFTTLHNIQNEQSEIISAIYKKILSDNKDLIVDVRLTPNDIIKLSFRPEIVNKPFDIDFVVYKANSQWVVILIFAFLGGVLLNFMPCILPVLSLKLLHFSKMSSKHIADMRKQCLATALGVMTALSVISIIVMILRSLGQMASLGLHMQSPFVIIMLFMVMVLFTFNLFDKFQIVIPDHFTSWLPTKLKNAHELLYSFGSGILVAIMATPCASPFYATAASIALTADNDFYVFLLFVFLGLGLSMPYLLVIVFPKLVKYLPKPGVWMMYLKYILAILFALTAIWLGYILVQQLGLRALIILLLLMVLIKFIWLRHDFILKYTVVRILLLLSLISTAFALPIIEHHDEVIQEEHVVKFWQSFDEDKLNHYIAEGKVVVLDITASWCITCQTNKMLVLNIDSTMNKMAQEGIIGMRADITSDSEVSKKAMDYMRTNFDHYGIPFNAVFGPKAPKGIKLDVFITTHALFEAIATAK